MTKLKNELQEPQETLNQETCKTKSANKKQENESKLNKYISNLINTYETFYQIEQRIESKNEFNLNNFVDEYENDEENDSDNGNDELKNWLKSRTIHFHTLIEQFDELCLFVANLKKDCYKLFIQIFQIKNLFIIQMYEFLNKLLKIQISPYLNSYSIIYKEKELSNLESKSVIIKEALELLHILTTNQNSSNKDDESSITCCDQLSKSFDFTSSISSLLIKNFTNSSRFEALNDQQNQTLLNEQTEKVAFKVLNKLTYDNKLFVIDSNIKELCVILVDKIRRNLDIQNSYLQFLTNILRNNTNEIEKLLKSIDCIKQFYKQLTVLIIESNAILALNSLIILIKLNLNDILAALCGNNATNHPPPSRLSTKFKNPSANTRMFDSIDMALTYLSRNVNDCHSDVLTTKAANDHLCWKLIALDFLYEFIKYEPVRKQLEKNDDYSNILLLKLNQLLIENDQASNYTIRISIKIFQIFNVICVSSDVLSHKLFQIVFNAPKFIENKTNGLTDKPTTNELTKKLKDLILSKNKKNKSNSSDEIIEYYLKFSCLSDEIATTNDDYIKMFNNGSLFSNYYLFLKNLFRNAENNEENMGLENQIGQFYVIMINNFNYLYSLLNLDTDKKVSGTRASFASDQESLIMQIMYYILSMIDSIFKVYSIKIIKLGDFMNKLFTILKKSCWLPSSNIKTTSYLYEKSLSEAGITLIICKMLIKLFLNPIYYKSGCTSAKHEENNMLKQEIIIFFKNEDFLRLLALITIERSSLDLNHLGYEIMFDLNQLTSLNYIFPLHLFLEINEKLKEQKANSQTRNDYMKYQLPNLNQAHLTTLPQISSFPKNAISNSDLDKVFEFYDYKINEQKRQETSFVNTLNQYFSKSLIDEVEFQVLRDELRKRAKKEEQLLKELAYKEEKYADLSEANSILEKKNDELLVCKNELVEHVERLKKEIEEIEKSNEISVENLQRTLSSEISAKKELQTKLKDANTKLLEIEKRKKELEKSLEDKSAQYDEKNSEHEKLKVEFNKIKAVLSYVKENI